jgi:hypothetical protein
VSIDPSTYLDSVSCPSASFCVAADGHGNALTYNLSKRSKPVRIDPNGEGIQSVSCSSASFCVAVGFVDNAITRHIVNGNALIYNGFTWSSPMMIALPDRFGLSSVSCASSSFCVAVAGNDNVVAYNGFMWFVQISIGSDNVSDYLTSVSCPSVSFCIVVDINGDVIVGHA